MNERNEEEFNITHEVRRKRDNKRSRSEEEKEMKKPKKLTRNKEKNSHKDKKNKKDKDRKKYSDDKDRKKNSDDNINATDSNDKKKGKREYSNPNTVNDEDTIGVFAFACFNSFSISCSLHFWAISAATGAKVGATVSFSFNSNPIGNDPNPSIPLPLVRKTLLYKGIPWFVFVFVFILIFESV